jgi:FkbM family methyltransferase
MRKQSGQTDIRTLVIVVIGAILIIAAIFLFRDRSALVPRHVFIDGGAHKGETIEHFLATDLYQKYDWEMYSFEANPHLISSILTHPKLTVIDKAIWTDEHGIDFYLGESTSSSSVVKDKRTGNLSSEPTRVGSVDFGAWISDNFSLHDFVFVKLDIEGAEYDVLEKMISDGTIDFIDALYVEFHNTKVNVPIEKDVELLIAIKDRGILTKVNPIQRENGDWFGN